MPTVASETAATVPKYSIDADAFVIYRGSSAYVSFEDDAARDEVARQEDVHVLSDSEGRNFERTLPFNLPERDASKGSVIGLGDLLSAVTRNLGLRECGGCRKRKAWLNKVPIWRWWVRA